MIKSLANFACLFAGLILFAPSAAKADAQRILFVDSGNTVSRAESDGSNITGIRSVSGATNYLAVDSNQRWLFILEDVFDGETHLGTITRSRLDGAEQLQIKSEIPSPSAIAVDGVNQKLYWAGVTTNHLFFIARSDLDGANEETIYSTTLDGTAGKIVDLAIDSKAGKVYWLETISSPAILQKNADGTGAASTVVDLSGSSELFFQFTLDPNNSFVYWSEAGDQAIYRLSIFSGSALPETVFQATSSFNPTDLAFDISSKANLYVANSTGANVFRINVGTTNPIDVLTNFNVSSLALLIPVTLLPGAPIIDAPDFVVPPEGGSVTLTLQDFDPASFDTTQLAESSLGALSATAIKSIRYDVTIRRTTDNLKLRRILKNAKTTINLSPGTYAVSYNARFVTAQSKSKKQQILSATNSQIQRLKRRTQTITIKNRIQALLAKRSLAGVKPIRQSKQSPESASFTVN